MPLLCSSRVFNRQLEDASFKKCASTIKTIFFSDAIDFWLRRVWIVLTFSMVMISALLFFGDSESEFFLFLPLIKDEGSITKKSG